MTFRCTSCQATLRFDEQKMAGRRTAKCPRCQTQVELPQTGTSAGAPGPSSSQATQTATVACGTCGVKLKVPAGTKASRSRCPRCGGSIDLAQAPERAARPEIEESGSAATRRIDSRALNMEMAAAMSSPASAGAPPMGSGIGSDDFTAPADRPAEPPPSLTRPAVGAMREAALGIQAATQGMDSQASMTAPPAAQQPPRPALSAATTAAREPTIIKAPSTAAQEAPAPRPSRKSVEPHVEKEKPRRPAPASYPLWRGGVAGALAGGLVGLGFWAGQGAIAANGLTWLVSTVPPAASIPAVPEWTLRLALLIAGAILAGTIAAGAGSPAAHTNALSLKRCMLSALLPGILVALLTILMGEQQLPEFAVWPAVNWMRDLLAAGLLTPAVNRFLPGR